jgi:signal recognition particle GTPase
MQVKASQARKEPYVIVFVGVNGVGKSTSLSKVAFEMKKTMKNENKGSLPLAYTIAY